MDVRSLHVRATIEHLPDPIGMLRNIRDVLKPGGRIFVDTGIGADWLDRSCRASRSGMTRRRTCLFFRSMVCADRFAARDLRLGRPIPCLSGRDCANGFASPAAPTGRKPAGLRCDGPDAERRVSDDAISPGEYH